jgi:hypothetical protein
MFDTLWYAYNGYTVMCYAWTASYYVWNTYYVWKLVGSPLLKLVG